MDKHDERLKFEVGRTPCGQLFFSLLGGIFKGGDQICNKLQEGLLSGSAQICIEDCKLSFICEGLKFDFKDDCNNLCKIKAMLNDSARGKKIERKEDDNYSGFRMVFE